MSRVIKFRAWDGDKKEMHLPEFSEKEDFHISAEGHILETHECGYERHELTSRRPDTWVLMQFTGLLDKNGKEIYEGDILSRRDMEDGEVRYEKGVWVIFSETSSDIWKQELHNHYHHTEVISNIYQKI